MFGRDSQPPSQTMTASQEEAIVLAARFRSIIEPAKALQLVLQVDLSNELAEFMTCIKLVDHLLLADVNSQEHRDSTAFDFNTAGRIVQGGTHIWLRKVDHLFASSADILRSLTHRKAHAVADDEEEDGVGGEEIGGADGTTAGVRKKRQKKRAHGEDMMWNVDAAVKVKSNVRVKQIKYANERPSVYLCAHILKLMPMVLKPLEEFEKSAITLQDKKGDGIGRKEDFRVNTCIVDTRTSALLLSQNYAKMIDQHATTGNLLGDDVRVPRLRSVTAPRSMLGDDEHTIGGTPMEDETVADAAHGVVMKDRDLIADATTHHKDGTIDDDQWDDAADDDGNDGGEDDEEPFPELAEADHVKMRRRPIPAAKRVKRTTIETQRKRQLRAIIRQQLQQHNQTIEMPTAAELWTEVKPIHQFIDEQFFMRRPPKMCRTTAGGAEYRVELDGVYRLAAKRRDEQRRRWAALAKAENAPVVEPVRDAVPPVDDFEVEDDDGGNDDEPDAPPAQQQPNLLTDHDFDHVDLPPARERSMVMDGDDDELMDMSTGSAIDLDALTFEQLIEKLIDQRMQDAGGLGVDTAITKRVQLWTDKIEAVQSTENVRRAFDIHSYSTDVIDFLKGREEGNVAFRQFVLFKELAEWEMCRYFLSLLMITNSGHISIDEAADPTPNLVDVRLIDGDKPVGTFEDEM